MSTTRHNVLPRRNDRLRKLQTVIAITLTLIVLAPSAVAQEPEKYLLLATYRTGTMQDELNKTGAPGYRFAGAGTCSQPPRSFACPVSSECTFRQ